MLKELKLRVQLAVDSFDCADGFVTVAEVGVAFAVHCFG